MAIDSNAAGQTRDQEKPITCPKCNAPMEKVTFQSITIDRCTACKGIWFDALEKEHLKALAGSESIDVGAPAAQRRDQPVRINCPVCHTLMIRMVDHEQPHLWYESCTVCYGVFFDAGEFRDYKEHTVLERLRDVFHRERK